MLRVPEWQRRGLATWSRGPLQQASRPDRVWCLPGEAAAVGSEAIYQHLLTRLPSEHFHNPMLAFEVIRFCRDNLPLFDLHVLGVLKSSFPNLFKARAVGHTPGCQRPGPIPCMQSWAEMWGAGQGAEAHGVTQPSL